MSLEEAQRQRRVDKRALFQRFQLPFLQEHFQRKLRGLFDNRCFRCGFSGPLELDHHIPQYLGGRLIPGNIVLLCARCNSTKGDTHPRDFYPASVLVKLEPILLAQRAMFDFEFNWVRFNRRPREYLASIGVPDDAIDLELKRRDDDSALGVVISFRIDDLGEKS
jgi:hypothetical protein